MDAVLQSAQRGYPRWLLMSIIVGICLVAYTFIVLYGFQYFSKKPSETNSKFLTVSMSAISGTLDLNGVPPSGSNIVIEVKKTGEPNFHVVIPKEPSVDGVVWSWNEAQIGTEYTVEALLQTNGQIIAKSKKLVVIAPAENETLTINVPTQPSPTTATPTLSSISGIFNIDGYVPTGATITIAARKSATAQFNTILTGLPATDNSVWSWTNANFDVMYELQATVVNNGTTIAQSQVITVTAPADGETLSLYSTAIPPTPTIVGISGTINLNGYVPPSGSYITLGVRVSGTSRFNQINNNISATDGVGWTYPNAQSGTSYDIQAYLWQNGSPYAQSQILTIPAPANNELLTINATTPPSNAPGLNSISINCNSYSSSANLWQITVNYNNNSAITNASQYWLTIGTNSGGNQQVSLVTNPSNPNKTQTYITGYIFNQSLTYYAQYAYASCANCGSWSGFSPSLTFTCAQPASTPVPTNTPTPTSTPIPTPTNTPVPPTNTP